MIAIISFLALLFVESQDNCFADSISPVIAEIVYSDDGNSWTVTEGELYPPSAPMSAERITFLSVAAVLCLVPIILAIVRTALNKNNVEVLKSSFKKALIPFFLLWFLWGPLVALFSYHFDFGEKDPILGVIVLLPCFAVGALRYCWEIKRMR